MVEVEMETARLMDEEVHVEELEGEEDISTVAKTDKRRKGENTRTGTLRRTSKDACARVRSDLEESFYMYLTSRNQNESCYMLTGVDFPQYSDWRSSMPRKAECDAICKWCSPKCSGRYVDEGERCSNGVPTTMLPAD